MYSVQLVAIFSSFFRYGKKLPYVVTRDVCPSVLCGNIFGTRLHYNKHADWSQIWPKYRGLGNACLNGAIFESL